MNKSEKGKLAYDMRQKGAVFREIGEALGVSANMARLRYLMYERDLKRYSSNPFLWQLYCNGDGTSQPAINICINKWGGDGQKVADAGSVKVLATMGVGPTMLIVIGFALLDTGHIDDLNAWMAPSDRPRYAESMAALDRYLLAHESEIDADENDFGDLDELFLYRIGRWPEREAQC